MKEKIANYRIEDFSEGDIFSFKKKITKVEVDSFAALSGDINPLHMDERFARARGFNFRVVHGALLVSYLSRLAGVHFPGENCLLQNLNINFLSPVYIDDTVEINAVVNQISLSTGVIVLTITIKNAVNQVVLARGRMQIGFTKPRDNI